MSTRRKIHYASTQSLFEVEPRPSATSIETTCSGSTTVATQGFPHSKRDPYAAFYSALGKMREEFHRIGRFDDANAKLDELCKILALKVLDARHPPGRVASRLSMDYLQRLARERYGDANRIAGAIHDVFAEIARKFPDDIETFGPRPGLNMSPDDDEFARTLVPLLESLPVADSLNGDRWEFDSLNEAFGHFVQDSFRNRKEDAQYMTPPEVVSMAVEIGFIDILADTNRNIEDCILVADPTCGVGSFLAAAYRFACHARDRRGHPLSNRLRLFGQDKVERMVRLSSVNLKVFSRAHADIRLGNSVTPSNGLTQIKGKVDLILTNPPFGATFQTSDVLTSSSDGDYPVLTSMLRERVLPKTLDSEYLLLDRELALLKPGGRMLMVVPDHVVSGNGFSEAFRRAVLRHAHLIAVVDLPTEAFAQAGTRTKTSVVYLQRHSYDKKSERDSRVFMANSQDLGFRVVSRSGAPIKQIVGPCDLNTISTAYRSFRESGIESATIACLSRSPSIAVVAQDHLLNDRWTAGFYRAERLDALQSLEAVRRNGFDVKHLPEIAEIDPEGHERVLADAENRCISVLHVREDGFIDLLAVDGYRPTTPGIRCRANDVLLSKINPRIPRICVVPEANWHLGCSAEFAVLRCRVDRLTPWGLLLLLRSSVVQAQIRTLTSGTSSSHNRVKDKDLASILIPIPKAGSTEAKHLSILARVAASSTKKYYESAIGIQRSQTELERLLGFTTRQPSSKRLT